MEERKGPETSVSWADPADFREAFGDGEAAKQRKMFDRLDWQRTPSPVESEDVPITLTQQQAAKLVGVFALALIGAVVVTVVVMRR